MRPTLQQMGGEFWMEIRDRKKLARILVIQGVTHRELAQAAGYRTHGHVGALLRGEKKTLTAEAAARIALYLGQQMEDLFVSRVTTNHGQDGQAA